MSNRFLFIAGIFFCLCLMPGLVWAQLIEDGNQRIQTIDKKNKKVRSTASISIKENLTNKKTFDLRIDGEGEYAGYKDVSWISEARIKESDGALTVQESSTKFFSRGRMIFQSIKNYDYTAKIVSVAINHGQSRGVLKREFPIKGPICDDVTLVHIFRMIVSSSTEESVQSFYLLTDEPKLYHVMVKQRADELLNLPSGQLGAEKFQLMADLGPLTEVASKIVPPTYVWFPKDDQHQWIQYEGMETGYETANIVAYRVDDVSESSIR